MYLTTRDPISHSPACNPLTVAEPFEVVVEREQPSVVHSKQVGQVRAIVHVTKHSSGLLGNLHSFLLCHLFLLLHLHVVFFLHGLCVHEV